MFEGHDAAGKGGAIRRITRRSILASYRVHPIAAPTDEEKARPYLWRFWRHVPRKGQIAIFDRSWYGRVLVERVEGFASRGRMAAGLWRDQRFRGGAGRGRDRRGQVLAGDQHGGAAAPVRGARAAAYKQFKITAEDWRNREKWDAYHDAIGDMIDRTSTPTRRGRWSRREDKRWARVKVLETLGERLEAEF